MPDFTSPDRPICAACGRRPAAVEVLWDTPEGRQSGGICQVCAQRFVAAGAGVPMSAAQAGGTAVRERQATETQSKTPALDEFGRDLTEDARAGRIDAVIGRGDEIEQTVEILSRRRKN